MGRADHVRGDEVSIENLDASLAWAQAVNRQMQTELQELEERNRSLRETVAQLKVELDRLQADTQKEVQ
jgi:hypothetical protein